MFSNMAMHLINVIYVGLIEKSPQCKATKTNLDIQYHKSDLIGQLFPWQKQTKFQGKFKIINKIERSKVT